MSPTETLRRALADATAKLYGDGVALEPAKFVQRHRNGQLGDLQVNAAFALAKQVRRDPRAIADELAALGGADRAAELVDELLAAR